MIKPLLLNPQKDPMGAAIADYYKNGKAGKLRVFSSMFDEDEIPVDTLFRDASDMSPIELKALSMASGRILDAGAGSGCHSLVLQEQGKEVAAIDISSLSVDTMRARGVKEVYLKNLFDETFQDSFDTILLLMNGSGVVGSVDNLPQFFSRMRRLLRPGGCILMDSSDLRYLFEDEDGSFCINLNASYYGEVDYQMQYKQVKGDSFDWLYIDFKTLEFMADDNGFTVELIEEGDHYDYLAKITLKTAE